MTTRDEFDVNRKTGSVASNGAVMPNGVVVTNVYEAWQASRAESEKEIAELTAQRNHWQNMAGKFANDAHEANEREAYESGLASARLLQITELKEKVRDIHAK